MNDYKINYTGESDGFQIVTERTEAAAKKFFLSTHKGIRLDITSIELHRENTCATKQQERDALEAIKKIVAELGPQSYLATAFDGAFEDAENNIDDDAAYSMKARWETEKKTCSSLRTAVSDLEYRLKTAELNERDLQDAITKAKKEASHTITALREQLLSDDDLVDIRNLLEDRECEKEEAEAEAAEKIVEYADNPAGEEFQQAVIDHRNLKKEAEYLAGLKFRVEAALDARHTTEG